MTTRFDDDPEGFRRAHGAGGADGRGGAGGHGGPADGSEDPLAVILRPLTAHADLLGPPPGRYEEIRRTAARRRLLRAAIGAALTCAAAVLVAAPLHLGGTERPVSPTVPLAPPPVTDATPLPSEPAERRTASDAPQGRDTPGTGPSARPADSTGSGATKATSEPSQSLSKRAAADERLKEKPRSRTTSGVRPTTAAGRPTTR
ncbi:hypothetical protein [Streptomyces sp. B3I8]|uniref:hypothetical protein n=1 Tax=Streptomyces sp. B3I8 TaxID=3042303 RepID=UPI00278334C6|nr:hypothetical protein [Streptomyces sp. B3I8]MDQ0788179.1 hypothetical protein [Streptomyces sp. B3I8]